MGAAEYKPVGLGLIFPKYIFGALEEHYKRLEAERARGPDPENPDEYPTADSSRAARKAHWSYLRDSARRPNIGQLVADAMATIERDNPSSNGVLPRDYARSALDNQRLGQLIDLVTNIEVGDEERRFKDILSWCLRVLLHSGPERGQGWRALPAYLRPSPVDGSGGAVQGPCLRPMRRFGQCLVGSVKFIVAHGTGNGGKARLGVSICRQESKYDTWRLPKTNLAIRSIDGQIADGDTSLKDGFPGRMADYLLAKPPFNMKSWGGEHLVEDKCWSYGTRSIHVVKLPKE